MSPSRPEASVVRVHSGLVICRAACCSVGGNGCSFVQRLLVCLIVIVIAVLLVHSYRLGRFIRNIGLMEEVVDAFHVLHRVKDQFSCAPVLPVPCQVVRVRDVRAGNKVRPLLVRSSA